MQLSTLHRYEGVFAWRPAEFQTQRSSCESLPQVFVSPRLQFGSGHGRLSLRRTSQVGSTIDNWHFSPSLSCQRWTLPTLDWTNASLTGLPLPFGWIHNVRGFTALADFRGQRYRGRLWLLWASPNPQLIQSTRSIKRIFLPESPPGVQAVPNFTDLKECDFVEDLVNKYFRGAEMEYNIQMVHLHSCIVCITVVLSLVQNDYFIF